MATAFVSKSRRVRFELTLRIHDLNNVPLVSGTSSVKWHLPSSTAAEHRGRTPKAAIKEHRVVFGYAKTMPVRLVVDKAGALAECAIHFDVQQEYSAGGRGERITLGHIRLNLAEYVEASEAVASPVSAGPSGGGEAAITAAAAMAASTAAAAASGGVGAGAGGAGGGSGGNGEEGGVTRRYLMQDSKINSTLKIGIAMRYVEGTRDFVAPPLRTAPVFSGIASIISSAEPAAMSSTPGLAGKMNGEGAGGGGGNGDGSGGGSGGGQEGDGGDAGMPTPNLSSRNKEAGEMQDMYRRTLAAYWSSQPGELKADECIEDIFAGGDGWGRGGRARPPPLPPQQQQQQQQQQSAGPAFASAGVSTTNANGEMTARDGAAGAKLAGRGLMGAHKRSISRHGAKTRPPRKGAGELDEMDLKDDLVSWHISEKAYS